MLSTIYNDEMEEVRVGGKATNKPSVCINYKKFRGVDLLDQISSPSPSYRKIIKNYYMKNFFRLLELTLHNNHVIYKYNGGRKTLLDFKLQLVEMLITSYGQDVHRLRKPAGLLELRVVPTRLTGRQFLIETGGEGKKIQRCLYCLIKIRNKRSIYSCDMCEIAICPTPCFKLYHTEEKLKKLREE